MRRRLRWFEPWPLAAVCDPQERQTDPDPGLPKNIPVRVCCGRRHLDVQCPDGLVMCCLCFRRFRIGDLHQLADGTREDVCVPCAEQEALAAERAAVCDPQERQM